MRQVKGPVQSQTRAQRRGDTRGPPACGDGRATLQRHGGHEAVAPANGPSASRRQLGPGLRELALQVRLRTQPPRRAHKRAPSPPTSSPATRPSAGTSNHPPRAPSTPAPPSLPGGAHRPSIAMVGRRCLAEAAPDAPRLLPNAVPPGIQGLQARQRADRRVLVRPWVGGTNGPRTHRNNRRPPPAMSAAQNSRQGRPQVPTPRTPGASAPAMGAPRPRPPPLLRGAQPAHR